MARPNWSERPASAPPVATSCFSATASCESGRWGTWPTPRISVESFCLCLRPPRNRCDTHTHTRPREFRSPPGRWSRLAAGLPASSDKCRRRKLWPSGLHADPIGFEPIQGEPGERSAPAASCLARCRARAWRRAFCRKQHPVALGPARTQQTATTAAHNDCCAPNLVQYANLAVNHPSRPPTTTTYEIDSASARVHGKRTKVSRLASAVEWAHASYAKRPRGRRARIGSIVENDDEIYGSLILAQSGRDAHFSVHTNWRAPRIVMPRRARAASRPGGTRRPPANTFATTSAEHNCGRAPRSIRTKWEIIDNGFHQGGAGLCKCCVGRRFSRSH
jgi:hypothetical protein